MYAALDDGRVVAVDYSKVACLATFGTLATRTGVLLEPISISPVSGAAERIPWGDNVAIGPREGFGMDIARVIVLLRERSALERTEGPYN